jgi:myo-inositol-1(or 4)-monophosphatase
LPVNRQPEIADVQAALHDVLREAGEVALKFFGRDPVVQMKKDNTPVTEADFAVDRHINKRLRDLSPGYGWISEESQTEPARDTSRTWIVDPIDGTRAFVRERDDWCISIGLIEDGEVILAGIYQPRGDDLYEACRGFGATLNGRPASVSSNRKIDGCRMIAYREALSRPEWPEPWPEMTYGHLNSMALRLAKVASGASDAVVTLSGKSDWDLAAGDLLVQEAGGKITDFGGQLFQYGGDVLRKPDIVAAGRYLHPDLVERTRNWPLRRNAT